MDKSTAKIKDLRGQKFGELTVLDFSRVDNHYATWLCRCSCGKECIINGRELRRGDTNSCGHLYRNRNGESHTRLYKIWSHLLSRCENELDAGYHNYGGRGISVCDEWHDYNVFRTWALSNGYSDNLTIDRVNVNGNYSPDNCKWSTKVEQGNNKRNNFNITVNGVTKTASEWSHATQINRKTIIYRYKRGLRGSDLFKPTRRVSDV